MWRTVPLPLVGPATYARARAQGHQRSQAPFRAGPRHCPTSARPPRHNYARYTLASSAVSQTLPEVADLAFADTHHRPSDEHGSQTLSYVGEIPRTAGARLFAIRRASSTTSRATSTAVGCDVGETPQELAALISSAIYVVLRQPPGNMSFGDFSSAKSQPKHATAVKLHRFFLA